MRWIITFSDLVTLMLVFFVMLFSVSSIDTERFDEMLSPASKRDVTLEKVDISKPSQIFNSEQEKQIVSDDTLDYIYNLLSLRVENNQQLSELGIVNYGNYLKLSLPSDIVFESNSVELKKEGRQLFLDVLQQLVNLSNSISFIAYSDPRKIVTGGYDSNEKLSLARATAVTDLMKKMGYEGQPTVLLGGTKIFATLDKKIPIDQRYALSRKIDIIIYASYLGQEELYRLPNV